MGLCNTCSHTILQWLVKFQFDIWFVIQYTPRNMHTVFALLCFVVVIHWLIYPYPSGLLHWHCGNLTIAPVPAKQPWWIWINTLCEFIMNDYITTEKQSATKPCAYFLGYTVCAYVTHVKSTRCLYFESDWNHQRRRCFLNHEIGDKPLLHCVSSRTDILLCASYKLCNFKVTHKLVNSLDILVCRRIDCNSCPWHSASMPIGVTCVAVHYWWLIAI